VPGKDWVGRFGADWRFGRESVVEFFRSGQAETNQGRVRKGSGNNTMMFTGTMIEELMATVERAEARTMKDLKPAEIEPWFAYIQENTNYDSKRLGVA
jgi:phage terminase Nu1 subunit (DNA packaging protein)